MKIILAALILLMTSCENGSDHGNATVRQEICGRDKVPVYRVKVPDGWSIKDRDPTLSLEDTRVSLCELMINDASGQVTIVIHNFPVIEGAHIPPMAQVARWKGQLTKLDSSETFVMPQTFSGYVGYFLEASEKGGDHAVMAWALQLAPEHLQTLGYYLKIAESANDRVAMNQMMADVTLKVTGPKKLLKKYRHKIAEFVRSFELIQEIPSSL